MTNKNRLVVHLFYNREIGASGEVRTVKRVKRILLFDVEYDEIPSAISNIVTEFYETCAWHEIYSITAIADEIYINGKLV